MKLIKTLLPPRKHSFVITKIILLSDIICVLCASTREPNEQYAYEMMGYLTFDGSGKHRYRCPVNS
jgi:hypothetical protein